jgi:hypothetical protein
MDRLLAEAADEVVVNVDDEQDNDSTIAPLRHRVRWGRGSSSSVAEPDSACRRGSLPPFLLFLPLPHLLLPPFLKKMEEGLHGATSGRGGA